MSTIQVNQITIGSPEYNNIIRAAVEAATTIGIEIGQKMSMPSKDRIGGYELAEEITGFERQTIYNMVSSGTIPCIKIKGKRPRFEEQALIKWMKGGWQK